MDFIVTPPQKFAPGECLVKALTTRAKKWVMMHYKEEDILRAADRSLIGLSLSAEKELSATVELLEHGFTVERRLS